MNARQRREDILRRLQDSRTVYTNALCEVYGVSAMTLRRDFSRLEAEGLITTIRGGAALNQGNAVLHSLELRQRRQPEELTASLDAAEILSQEKGNRPLSCRASTCPRCAARAGR